MKRYKHLNLKMNTIKKKQDWMKKLKDNRGFKKKKQFWKIFID